MVTTGAAVVDRFSLQLTLILFLSVVVVTLFTALLTAPQRDEIAEFYLGNRTMSPLRNGLAMCGDYLSAATLLGSTGLVALTGYDGLLYLCGTAVAWMMVLLLIAEPLRNAGRFTLGDTIALRLPRGQRPVRLALAVCTLAIATLYLVAQLVGSVALLTQFTGEPSATTRTLCVVVIGTIVIVYAAIGGMPGATFIQVVKAVMLISGVTVTAVMVLHRFDWNPDALLTALLSCLAFVTLLAVAAGLTLAAASSLAHDLYGEVIRKGQAKETEELAVARLSAVVIGVLGMLLALIAWGANTATLAFLAFAIAASALLPTLVYTLFWRRFTAQGALLSLCGGLLSSVLLVVFSPVVSSTPSSLYPSADFAWFPLQNPGLVSIPAGFLLGWLGSVLTRPEMPENYADFEVRTLVGIDEK
ncbi:sodium:solute symporter family transporter [Streptomyces justiciae]|uniref:Cation acetate symporter n=1 Tax=Streptomyces justiciae TaxID=2780140 RepID=A0ABU3M9D9_9ACTN|nr:cation acetate symporter [Streptomyces justiciae]MDT7847766.1 cation acetate symporter [Streptomyces justiciae]